MIKMLATIFLLTLPAIHSAAAQEQATHKQPVLNLSASASDEVRQDELMARLVYRAEGADALVVQKTINTVMQRVAKKLKKADKIQSRFLNYNVYFRDPARNKVKTEGHWIGSQSIMLTAADDTALLALIGTLQEEGMAMQSMSYQVSHALRGKTQANLQDKALKNLMDKANAAAASLGMSRVKLLEVWLDETGRPEFRRRMEISSMQAVSDSPPVAQAGMDRLAVTVRAKILMEK